jgi:hypothetical protein
MIDKYDTAFSKWLSDLFSKISESCITLFFIYSHACAWIESCAMIYAANGSRLCFRIWTWLAPKIPPYQLCQVENASGCPLQWRYSVFQNALLDILFSYSNESLFLSHKHWTISKVQSYINYLSFLVHYAFMSFYFKFLYVKKWSNNWENWTL